ncbi:hypothetical protein [Actinoallomurus sp. NPDC052274]|uniref:hypothetical protein n=1 Tax=Actinoallomurus sp. NPDC052274 TaxID=3155420 RepID=UPI00343A77B0
MPEPTQADTLNAETALVDVLTSAVLSGVRLNTKRLAAHIRLQKRRCPTHPEPARSPSCPACARNDAFERSALIVLGEHATPVDRPEATKPEDTAAGYEDPHDAQIAAVQAALVDAWPHLGEDPTYSGQLAAVAVDALWPTIVILDAELEQARAELARAIRAREGWRGEALLYARNTKYWRSRAMKRQDSGPRDAVFETPKEQP